MDESKKHLKYPCAFFISLYNYKMVMGWRACEMIFYLKGMCCDTFLSSWLDCRCDLGSSASRSTSRWEFSSASPEHALHWEGKNISVIFMFRTIFLMLKG